MAWLFLIGAIAFEVAATLALRMATHGKKMWFVAVAVGYLAAFGFLSLTLDAGIGLGVAYGVWAASGVALTALLSKLLFKEPSPGSWAPAWHSSSVACFSSSWESRTDY